MKKTVNLIILIILLFTIVGCETENEQHTHTYLSNTIPSTCTEKGSIEYRCPCGHFYVEELEISEHVFSDWTIVEEADNDKEGKKQRICLKCNYIETEIIESVVHTHMYTGKVVNPTCINKGYTEYKCECGHSYIENEIESLGHSYTDWVVVKEATENEEGLKEKKCIICGNVISETIVHSHTHSYKETKIEPECESDGYTEYKCECGYAYKENIVKAPGHLEQIIPGKEPTFSETGLSEGVKCKLCDKILVEQKVLPILVDNTLSITWYDSKFNLIEEERTYDSSKGLNSKDFLTFEKEGYEFLGWSTKRVIESENDLVSIIGKGPSQSITLYAQWKAKEYNIVYNGAFKNSHSNPTKYTIEDALTLENAEWIGLKFVQWSNTDGEKIESINLGTIGDITLEAQWVYEENLMVQSKDYDYSIEYDEEEQLYYFVFHVGTIENVVINELFSGKKDVGSTLSYTKTNSVSISEENAITVSNTVSDYVSNTVNYEETIGYIKSKTKGFEVGGSVNVSAEWPWSEKVSGTVGGKIGGKYNQSTTKSWSEETTIGGQNSTSQTNENSFASTIAYNNTYSTSITASLSIGENSPKGTYRFVSVGKVYIFTVLTFDYNENKFYFDTYSVMDDELVGMSLYTPDSDLNINVSYSEGFSYEMPSSKIVEQVENAYRVNYNSNGADGEMLQSVFLINKKGTLLENKFSKEGYFFIGWSTTPNGVVEFNDCGNVNNIANKGETIDLYAQWSANTYEVTLDAAGGSLSANKIYVTYNSQYGKLPEPTKEGYKFSGWYYGNTKIDDNSIVETKQNHTLKAKWMAEMYNIYYDATGGLMLDEDDNLSGNASYYYAYNTYTFLLGEPTRSGYKFTGWKFYRNGTLISFRIGQAMPSYNIEAVATWEMKSALNKTIDNDEYGGSGINKTIDASKEYHLDYFKLSDYDLNVFANSGYLLTFTFKVYMKEESTGVQEVYIANKNNTKLAGVEFAYGGSGCTSTKGWSEEQTIKISGEKLTNELHFVYGAHGEGSDDWVRYEILLSITVSKK